MAITITAVHKRRLISQIEQNLTGLQRDMVNNAKTHKAMCVAQSPEVATVGTYATSSGTAYLVRLQWVIDLRNDSVRRQRLVDMLASVGWTEQEIVEYVTALRAAAIALRDASKATYAEITAACDAVLAAVDMPESLWPE